MKRARLRLLDSNASILAEMVITLPHDFKSVNASHPHMMSIVWEMDRPEEVPERMPDLPEDAPPFYPYNFELSEDGKVISQPEQFWSLSTVGIFPLVEDWAKHIRENQK